MFLFIQNQARLEATDILCQEADKPNAMCLVFIWKENPFLHHHSTENIWGIAEKGPTLVDIMRSKYFQTWWLLFHLVKIFENVAVGVDGFS